METIEAIYEHGVFRPIVPVVLPEKSRVQLQILNGETSQDLEAIDNDDMEEIYKILDKRFSSGHTDTAARHNEHQP
jgi:predicted DNA-binding antitoxin AbrB/MazE fold protein